MKFWKKFLITILVSFGWTATSLYFIFKATSQLIIETTNMSPYGMAGATGDIVAFSIFGLIIVSLIPLAIFVYLMAR